MDSTQTIQQIEPLSRLIEVLTLDNASLLTAIGLMTLCICVVYYYAVRLSLGERRGPFHIWIHLTYIAPDNTYPGSLCSMTLHRNGITTGFSTACPGSTVLSPFSSFTASTESYSWKMKACLPISYGSTVDGSRSDISLCPRPRYTDSSG
ncbi:hypothetical protein F5Y07DRAFT_262434 [Xylaria sp. FL0933]|nr:hypothetical protein F5Y07DRAFT_262434 [Xylaria sp. FL0933]